MKFYFQQLAKSLKRVETSIEVFEDDLGSILFLDFIRVDLAVLLLYELHEVL